MTKPKPTNIKLYNKIKADAKRKFDVYPSIYANSWLVREYKRRGGKYSGKKTSSSGLSRWYKEEWIDTCKLPRIVKCGRPSTNMSFGKWKRTYPYCRPRYKVNAGTPKTASSLSKSEIARRCSRKKSFRRCTRKVLCTPRPRRLNRGMLQCEFTSISYFSF